MAPGAPLTSREREILEMLAEGAHNRTIAARLGAASRTEAVALALRGGLLAV